MCERKQHNLSVAEIHDLPSTSAIVRSTDLHPRSHAIGSAESSEGFENPESLLPRAISEDIAASAASTINNGDPEREKYFRDLRRSLDRYRK